jgi:hypothetical protein
MLPQLIFLQVKNKEKISLYTSKHIEFKTLLPNLGGTVYVLYKKLDFRKFESRASLKPDPFSLYSSADYGSMCYQMVSTCSE